MSIVCVGILESGRLTTAGGVVAGDLPEVGVVLDCKFVSKLSLCRCRGIQRCPLR